MEGQTEGTGKRTTTAGIWLLVVALAVLVGCRGADEVAGADPEPPAETDPSDDPAMDVRNVEIFLTNLEMGEIGEVFPVARETADADLPSAALEQLLTGPTSAERGQGYSSWFSQKTSDLLISLRIDDHVAHADFEPALATTIPNASSSAGSLSLLAELDATLEQFDDISSTRYSLGGDVAAFYGWLQLASPDATSDDEPASSPTEAAPAPRTATVEVYFSNPGLGTDDEIFPVERRVESPAVLRAAIGALLGGPHGRGAGPGSGP